MMGKQFQFLWVFSKVQYFSILIVLSSCDKQYHSVLYDDCVDFNISNSDFSNSTTSLTKCADRKKDNDVIPRTKRNISPSEPVGLIPLLENDSDLGYLTKFSGTEFLDKILGQRIFNTTMNVIVPMFHVILPMHAASGSTMHLAMQATLGLFSLAAWAFTVIIPSLFTYIIPFGIGYRSLGGTATTLSKMSHFNHQKFNELSEKVGLDWNTCLQKTVCEVHRFPKKYGIVSTLFQMFSLSYNKTMELSEHNSTTKYAAEIGVQDHPACEEKFKCFFDILDLGKYLIDLGYYNYLMVDYI